jgi:hypothetical protein
MSKSTPTAKAKALAASMVIAGAFACPALGAEGGAIPHLFGQWGRAGLFRFEPPWSGPGPVTNTSRFPDTVERVGDYTNLILTPQSADVVRRRGAAQLAGANFPDPRNQCRPEPPPFILALEFEVQILQKNDEIDILYVYGHQIRRIRMNASHSAHASPSWYGDSIGHYEGDTLVVDTVGVKVGPLSMVDIFGTPHSEALHLVERYRLINGETASKAVPARATPFGNEIDQDTKKEGLQVEFTVSDPGAFTMPWSAVVTYRPLKGAWLEVVCAENNGLYFSYDADRFPHTDKPDF